MVKNKDKSKNEIPNPTGATSVKGILKQIKKDTDILDKLMVDFEQDEILFDRFVHRVDFWYSSSHIQQMYKHVFGLLGPYVNYSNFIAGLIDLNAPCNDLERHILARLLDQRQTDKIPYQRLQELLWKRYGEKSAQLAVKDLKDRELHLLNEEVKPDRMSCGLDIQKWLLVYIKMIKFDKFPEHPGNLEVMFSDDTGLDEVAIEILKLTELPTTSLRLYNTSNCPRDDVIDQSKTFKELGIFGGLKFAPEEIIIYYDYDIGYIDDSLLMDSKL